VGKATELTVQDLFQEELRKRGVKVASQVSFETPVGRMQPDIVLRNGAQYVVETKLGAETKLLDAMVQLYDYSKYVPESKGAFAVLFPAELRRPWPQEVIERIALDPKTQYNAIAIFKDFRPSQPFKGSLGELADWISSHVLRMPVVEADTGFAIRVLRDAVSYVTASVRMLKGEELEDIFGGKSVFENILQYKEGRYPLEEMRQAATYLLVNQILFYHVLSSIDRSFETINEDRIDKPEDLVKYFETVLKKDYTSVFGFDVVSRLPENAADVIKKVVMAIKALAPQKIRHDILGKVFHELIPFEVRKAVAAFYTNNEAAEILAQLAIDKPDAKVIDLAVGSGTLLVAAYRRKRDLLKKAKGVVELEELQKSFIEKDLTGIDVMPFAAHLAVVALSLQAVMAGHESEKVRIAVWDSTELKPGQIIPAISRELKEAYKRPTLEMFMKGKPSKEDAYIKKGAVTLEGIGGEQIKLEKADLVIMNPPFTRQQRIPKKYKEILQKRFSNYSEYLHGQLGYHGYFILLADRFVKQGGRLALVLPASVLNADGFLKIRELLVNNYHIEHIITTWQRAAFSEGAQFREILLIAKKEHFKSKYGKCVLSELKKLPSNLKEAEALVTVIKNVAKKEGAGVVFQDEKLQISLLPSEQVKGHFENLFRYIAFSDKKLTAFWESIVDTAKHRLVTLGSYLKDYGSGPKEGAALGQIVKGGSIGSLYVLKDPSRALKKTDAWILKETGKRSIVVEHNVLQISVSIPTNVLLPALRRFSGINIIDISNELDFIVTKEFLGISDFLPQQLGNKIDKQSLKLWKRYVEGLRGNLLLANHVDISAPGTSILAYFASDSIVVPRSMWSMKLPATSAKVFALWLNSTLGLLQMLMQRRETRGAYLWFVASTIKKFLVPDMENMTEQNIQALLQTFEKINNVKFPSILEQLETKFQYRVEMDKVILRVLGFDENEISRLLDYLYSALAKEIRQLKTLMEG